MIESAILEEIAAVCRRHGVSLSHEDRHGGFLLVPHNAEDEAWLLEAAVTPELEAAQPAVTPYTSVPEPIRGPLLALVERHGVEWVVALLAAEDTDSGSCGAD